MPCVYLGDRAGIGAAAFVFAWSMSFDQRACWEIAIVVQELVSNMVRHAGGGQLELQAGTRMLQIIASDQGPGIAENVVAASATSQHGLGAVRRLMHAVEIDSRPTLGTRVVARRYLAPRR
jgi:anti-sigma regulatory factor (Ser/Thr protein kinase)